MIFHTKKLFIYTLLIAAYGQESTTYRPFWIGPTDRSEDVVLNSDLSPQRGQIMMKMEEENDLAFEKAAKENE